MRCCAWLYLDKCVSNMGMKMRRRIKFSIISTTHLRIQRPLQLQHVGVLLGIYVVIREIHQQSLDVEPEIKLHVSEVTVCLFVCKLAVTPATGWTLNNL